MEQVKKDLIRIFLLMVASVYTGLQAYLLHIEGEVSLTMVFLGLTIFMMLITVFLMITTAAIHLK